MATTITKLASGLYQIDDNLIPVERDSIAALAAQTLQFATAVDAWMQNLDVEGKAGLDTVANRGVVVDMYEVDYPIPGDPMKETQDLASHLNEKEDFITQILFPQSTTDQVIVGLREDILKQQEKKPMNNAVSSLRLIAEKMKNPFSKKAASPWFFTDADTGKRISVSARGTPNGTEVEFGNIYRMVLGTADFGQFLDLLRNAFHEGNRSVASFKIAKEEKGYTTDNKVTLPNSATFTGDMRPSSGDPVKKEQDAWKKGDKLEDQNISKENKAQKSYNSPVATGDADLQSVKDQMKQDSAVAPHLASVQNLKNLVSDLTFTKEPDGTVEIEMTDAPPTIPPAQQTLPAVPPAVPVPADPKKAASLAVNLTGTIRHKTSGMRGIVLAEQPDLQKIQVTVIATGNKESWNVADVTHTPTTAWVIDKKAGKTLLGTECATNAGIEITDDNKVLKSVSVLKNGHSWREVIPQGVYQEELQ